MTQDMDADKDEAIIQGLQTKVSEARKELQALKPQLTQHTNVGHHLSELERKRAQAVQRKADQEKATAEAQAEIAKIDEQVAKYDQEIVAAKRELVQTLPEEV